MEAASRTAVYPGRTQPDTGVPSTSEVGDADKALSYVTLGLNGEAGEVAEKVKKHLRGDAGEWSDFLVTMEKELGDVLWYWSQLCYELGLDPDDVAQVNLDKLQSRAQRGKIKGSGDTR
jgi:NTP pyrophosphatase (non-canonical NTP hydrolase)